MEAISVFDIFKIGVGPSSSHTLGPWRAARFFLEECRQAGIFDTIERVQVDLYGSLAKTGVGHGTDIAVQMGFLDFDPEFFDPDTLETQLGQIKSSESIRLGGFRDIGFRPAEDIVFHKNEMLPFHPNGIKFTAFYPGGKSEETYYSVGGGFVVTEEETPTDNRAVTLPYPMDKGSDWTNHVRATQMEPLDVVRQNELVWRSQEQIDARFDQLWATMRSCIYRGVMTDGELPGGLRVTRRAAAQNTDLLRGVRHETEESWVAAVRAADQGFHETLRWVSCFALAVNEENAAFGRVVTAPTNGAAGVIPAVMMYAHTFEGADEQALRDFLMVAGQIGIFFKKGATISAAMGGCMAEIGVSSAMAAAGLAYVRGANLDRVLMAAEIAMEHHLGMTCDPIAGLVQIPCIERNTMGAMKAITAAEIALSSDPSKAKVSLDAVIRTMWDTAKDMNAKYKETSEGGLAVNIPVIVPEC